MDSKVDVLATFDHVLSRMQESEVWWIDSPERGGFDAVAIAEAREAIAELIAAAQAVNAESKRERDTNDALFDRIAELESALQRITGDNNGH